MVEAGEGWVVVGERGESQESLKVEGGGSERSMAVIQEVPLEVRRRLAVVQRMLAARGDEDYGVVQGESARELGISVSSVQRLMRRWKEQGVAGLYRQTRKDRGVVSTSREWQEFIVKTYREGNRGSCRMSRAQVYVRVKVRAQELGSEECPGRTTVYRLLKPEIEKAERQAQRHSIGWKGERLSLKTRDGKEITVE